MGSCFGRCLPNSDRTSGFRSIHLRRSSGVDFTCLVEDEGRSQRKFFSRYFSRRKKKTPVLEMLNPQVSYYSKLSESGNESVKFCDSRDISLQCLDARALLARTATSTPASSLDLEWEHEAVPMSSLWTTANEEPSEKCDTSNVGASDWSRVSSTNSLEWDNVQHALHPSLPPSELDTDTQLLLCEIERLTSQTLSETGLDLYS